MDEAPVWVGPIRQQKSAVLIRGVGGLSRSTSQSYDTEDTPERSGCK